MASNQRYTDLEYQVMALSIGSKLINCGEVLDWTLLLEGTGHVARLYKPLHQCSDAQLAMVLQIWRCCEVYDRCSKGSGTQQLILKLLRLAYGSVYGCQMPIFTLCKSACQWAKFAHSIFLNILHYGVNTESCQIAATRED